MRGRQPTPSFFAVALIAAVVLAGCAQTGSQTGYRVQEKLPYWEILTDGYTDQIVGENEHSIVAVGNTITTKERTAQLALLRAARLTLEQGHQRFVIIHGTSTRQRIGTAHMVAIPGIVVPIVVSLRNPGRPTAILIIRLMSDDEAPPDAFDAKTIEAALAPVFE